MKKLLTNVFYTSLILVGITITACTSNNDDDIIDPQDPGNTTFLTLEKKYNNAITQPTVTLIGAIANDFEVIDAGYWESGNTLKFVNGVISLRYIGTHAVSPTAVKATLKNATGNIMALKVPIVTSLNETSYILSGGSTFLRNVSPLSFEYQETVDLGGGASVTSTVTSENNTTYAQPTSGKNVVQLIQLLTGNNTSNPDFTGIFSDFSSVELEYFTQTENINNNNAYVKQRYFQNTSEISNPTGSFTVNNPVYDTNNGSWSFSITNNTNQSNTNVGYRFVLQDTNGTTVAFEIDTNMSFSSNETKQFTIGKSDLYNALSFLSETEIQNLSVRVLLEW